MLYPHVPNFVLSNNLNYSSFSMIFVRYWPCSFVSKWTMKDGLEYSFTVSSTLSKIAYVLKDNNSKLKSSSKNKHLKLM